MWLWFAVSALPFCFGVSHSPTFRRRSKFEGLEEPFCNVEAKVPSEAGNGNLMSQFSALTGSPMVSQDSSQSKALECIDNFYGRDCDSTLALNYTKTPNKKVAASAALHYGERLKKGNGMFGCSCKEYYVDGLTLKNEFFVGTMYCVFASKSSQEHAEKFISVKVGSTLAIWDVNNGAEAILLSTGPTGKEPPKPEKETAIFSPNAKPPTDLEKDVTDDMVQELWYLLTSTSAGIAEYVEAEYRLGIKAKSLLIEELKTQKRYARFEWVGQYANEAMFSERLPDIIYSPEMAVDKMLKTCEPYIVYNLKTTRAHYYMVEVGCGLLKTSIGIFGTCLLNLIEMSAESPITKRQKPQWKRRTRLGRPLLTRMRLGAGA